MIFADYYNAGNVPEDVINTMWDPSVRRGPLLNAIAHISTTSSIKEFFDKTLRTPKTDNVIADGGNSSRNDTSKGIRYKQPMQLQDGLISLGAQAQASDSFDMIASLATQLGDRASELDRDSEARALSEKASVLPSESGPTAGECAGLFAQIKTATAFGATGSDGGWNANTGVFDAPTPGTAAAMSEATLLGVMETANTNGANLNQMHMIPALKTKFSQFMMTSSARIGTLITNAPAEGQGGATAVQSIDVYKTDHGTVEVVNNRIMQPEAADRSNVGIFETAMLNCVDQWTPRADRLGKQGAGDTWQVTNSFGVIALTERSHAAYRDIDHTADVVP